MLPKFDDVPISTYLRVLAKIRRPSATPSASTCRSLRSRMTSAASFATSAALSTEMPTSAACSARASFTPSPRNATPPAVWRRTRTMRAFCSGLTRAKTVVPAMAAASCWSSRPSMSGPVSAEPVEPAWSSPSSSHTRTATWALSPVTTLTSIPRSARRCSAGAASGLGGSRNTSSPCSWRSRSSSAVGRAAVVGRVATATTRLPAANSRCRALVAACGASTQRASTASGAPLVTRVHAPSGLRTTTETMRRSWSNPSTPTRW